MEWPKQQSEKVTLETDPRLRSSKKSVFIGSGHVGLKETTGAAKAVVGICLEKQLNMWSLQLTQP